MVLVTPYILVISSKWCITSGDKPSLIPSSSITSIRCWEIIGKKSAVPRRWNGYLAAHCRVISPFPLSRNQTTNR